MNPVLRLTDDITLDHVAVLARSNTGPTLYSVTAVSAANPEPRAIIGTRAQLRALRDLLTDALDVNCTLEPAQPHAGWGIHTHTIDQEITA